MKTPETLENPWNQKTTPQSGVEVIGSAQENIKNQTQKALETSELRGEYTVARRVYFVRHAKSVDDTLENKKNRIPQDPKAKLSFTGKKQSIIAARNLGKLGLADSEDVCFLYSDDTTRVNETLGIIVRKTSKSCEMVLHDRRLATSKKKVGEDGLELYVDEERLEVDIEVTKNTISFMKDLRTQPKYEKFKHIVFVAHKSNKPGVTQSVENKQKPIGGDFDIANGEILEIDISENGNYIDYKKAGILQVTSKNYHKLKEIFPEIEAKDVVDFQNELNKKFFLGKYKYEEYIFQDYIDLKIVCFIHMMKKGLFDFIIKNLEQILRGQKEKEVIKLSKILLDIAGEEQKKILLSSFAHIPNLLTKLDCGTLEYYASYQKYVTENISYLRNKTLDENIKYGQELPFHLGFSDENIRNLEDLLTQKEVILIEGEAGVGKSMKLLEIMEYLKPKEDYNHIFFPVYINLGEMKFKKIKGDIELQKSGVYGKGAYTFVYLFDALDESGYDEETKNDFLAYAMELQENGGKVIITSRPGIKISNKEKTKHLSLTKVSKGDSQNYVNSKLDADKIKVWYEWSQNNKLSQDIESNPLILSIICNLIASGEDISRIQTKKDLYQKIVQDRLLSWEKLRNNTQTDKDKIAKRESFLSLLAYKSLILGEKITQEVMNELIGVEDRYQHIFPVIDEQYDFSSLNFIFENNGEYSFIHESFREYFASFEIFNEMKRLEKMQSDCEKFINQYGEDATVGEVYQAAQKQGINFDILFNNSQKLNGFIRNKIDKLDYNILSFLLELVKKDEKISQEIVKIFYQGVQNRYQITGKELYIISKLDIVLGTKLFKKFTLNKNKYKESYEELFDGILKSDIKGKIKYIRTILKNLIKDNNIEMQHADLRYYSGGPQYYNFNRFLTLIINNNLQKEVYELLYNEIFLDSSTNMLYTSVFEILYAYTEDKVAFLKQILNDSKNNQFISHDKNLLNSIYEIIAQNHTQDIEYLLGDILRNSNIPELIKFDKDSIEGKMFIDLILVSGYPQSHSFLKSYESFFLNYCYQIGFDIDLYVYFLNKVENKETFSKNIFKYLIVQRKNISQFIDKLGLSKKSMNIIFQDVLGSDFYLTHTKEVYKKNIKGDVDEILYYLFIVFRDTDHYGDKYWNSSFNRDFDREEFMNFLKYIGYSQNKINKIFSNLSDYIKIQENPYSTLIKEHRKEIFYIIEYALI